VEVKKGLSFFQAGTRNGYPAGYPMTGCLASPPEEESLASEGYLPPEAYLRAFAR